MKSLITDTIPIYKINKAYLVFPKSFSTLPSSDKAFLLSFSALSIGLIIGSYTLSALCHTDIIQTSIFKEHLAEANHLNPFHCLFKKWTSLPCATCGLTRAMVMMAQNNWIKAFQYNILSIPIFITAFSLPLVSLTHPKQVIQALKHMRTPVTAAAFVVLLFLAWGVKLLGPSVYW